MSHREMPIFTPKVPLPDTLAISTQGPGQMVIDFETACDLDLTKVSAHQYVSHPSFEILLAAYVETPTPNNAKSLDMRLRGNHYRFLSELKKYVISAGDRIAAHNATFERLVMRRLIEDLLPIWEEDALFVPGEVLQDAHYVVEAWRDYAIFDTASLASQAGLSRSLDKAGRQLGLSQKKDPRGEKLIKMFCIERKNPMDFPAEWGEFQHYAEQDVVTTAHLVRSPLITELCRRESVFRRLHRDEMLTFIINDNGWPVDTELAQRFWEASQGNDDIVREQFLSVAVGGMKDLNLDSPTQVVRALKERGLRISSVDEETVDKFLHAVTHRIGVLRLKSETTLLTDAEAKKFVRLQEARHILQAKADMGKAALKKLPRLLELTSEDNRLYDSYMHAGAGQTARTTGTGVQMQNLKRLPRTVPDLDDEDELDRVLDDNVALAQNMRQLFKAEDGSTLIVGDFSSVEAIGLAWLAGEEWPVAAFRADQDLYKRQAAEILSKPYLDITPEDRAIGKLGVLSCGYGAGAGAVQRFGAKTGLDVTLAEAQELVTSWRTSRPQTVEFWRKLQVTLEKTVDQGGAHMLYLPNVTIQFFETRTPEAIRAQNPLAKSIGISIQPVVSYPAAPEEVVRFVHGVYRRGRDLVYFRPALAKSEEWRDYYTDPATKKVDYFRLYGGKLAGILTQSICREVFFSVLARVQKDMDSSYPPPGVSARVIGQFHDEIILEVSDEVKDAWVSALRWNMSTEVYNGFPLKAEIKTAKRYTK